MFKGSTTSPLHSFRCSSLPTLVRASVIMLHGLGLTCGETTADADPEDINPSILPPAVLAAVEADSFWCLSGLLNGIPDNYTTAQPGIQRSVKRMAELVARIDVPLSEHLAAQGVEFMQFAFRWMNCLLMREISVKNTVRMWDTYLVRLRLALLRHGEEKQRYADDGWTCDSQKDRTPFLSFIFTSVQRFSSGGATSSVRWISRFVEGFMSVSHPQTDSYVFLRASLCSCNPCRHKTGQTTKSRCSSARRTCSIRSGTTRRVTLQQSEPNITTYHFVRALPSFARSFSAKAR
jgi:Rab-GTPase-TBC domain